MPAVTWDVAFYNGSTWESIKPDVRFPVVASWGIRGFSPVDRVATTGNLNVVLDNSQYNAAGSIGYYTPEHANAKAGWDFGGSLRVGLVYAGASHYKKFYITDVAPEMGIYRERVARVNAQDYIGKMGSQYAEGLQVITTATVDEGMGSAIALMPVQPLSTNISTGIDELPYIFHDIDGRRQSIMNALQRLAQTDLGYLFVSGGTSTADAEVLTYQNRHDRLLTDPSGTINNTMVAMQALRSEENIINSIAVVCQPVDLGTEDEICYTLQREQEVAPRHTVTLRCRFRDPTGGAQRVRIAPGDGATPVAGTDYKMSSVEGNNGSDLNASLTITIDWFADYADVSFFNTSYTQTGYINLFTLKGLLIRIYDTLEVVEESSAANLDKYGKRQLRFQLPYMDNPFTADDFAHHILNKWENPETIVDYIEIVASASSELLSLAMVLDIGSRLVIAEPMTGTNAEYNVNGVEWQIGEGGILRAKYFLEPTIASQYWYLGTTGLSEIGQTTYLGF